LGPFEEENGKLEYEFHRTGIDKERYYAQRS